jgi:predicted O-methyltransferase YrrM
MKEFEGVEFVHDLKPVALDLAQAGTWAEFGVFRGNSARHWLAGMPDDTHIHLFDSFKGLPEHWDMGGNPPRRSPPFTMEEHEIPDFHDVRVTMHKGLFADTLPKADMGVLSFVNIDCDLYSSTTTVLKYIEVEAGTIMIFDEFHGYPNYEQHEYKAYYEWSERTGHELEWLAYGRMGALGIVK